MNVTHILRISSLELKRNKGLARKEFLLTIIPAIIIFSVIFITLMSKGFFVGDDFYRISTEDEHLRSIFGINPKFIIADDFDVEIIRAPSRYYVDHVDTERGKSAFHSAIDAIKQYNNLIYSQLPPQFVYPLLIRTTYVERKVTPSLAPLKEQESFDTTDRNGLTKVNVVGDVQDAERIQNSERVPESTDAPLSQIQSSNPDIAQVETPSADVITLTQIPAEAPIFPSDAVPPSQINALISFRSMYLAMVLIFPFTMVGLLYANSVIADKVNRRVHLLLTAPLSTADLIIGKALPYLFLSLISVALITFRITGMGMEFFSTLIICAIIMFVYCAIAFTVSTLARDSKELSFLLIFFLSMYSFLLLIPTFLTTISDLSLISPLTIVAKIFDGYPYMETTYLLTLIPHILIGIILYVFSASMYNEENLFGYRTIVQKITYGLSSLIKKPHGLLLYTAATVPFAFVFEMMMMFMVLSASKHLIVLVLFLAAAVEEGLKCTGYWVVARRKEMSLRDILLWGFFGGLGFFLIEKGSLLIVISDVLKSYSLIVLSGLLVPLLLHVGLAIAYFSLIRLFGKNYGLTSYWIVTLTHFLINLNLVRLAL